MTGEDCQYIATARPPPHLQPSRADSKQMRRQARMQNLRAQKTELGIERVTFERAFTTNPNQ
jgi:hypothetical protein